MTKKRKAYIPPEHDEQVVLVKWLRAKRIFHFSVPNSSALSSLNRNTAVKVGSVLKSEGLIKGASDLVVMLPSKILFIEMKRACKSFSTVSEEQKKFLESVNSFQYAGGKICYGAKDAMDFIESHLVVGLEQPDRMSNEKNKKGVGDGNNNKKQIKSLP
jgi:hypothetical protein